MELYDKILAGGDIDEVLSEVDFSMSGIKNAVSGLGNFAFGRSALSAAGGGGTPANTSQPPSGSVATGQVDMAHMAQAQADRVLKTPFPSATSNPTGPKAPAAATTTPRTENALPSMKSFASASTLTKTLKPKTSVPIPSLKSAVESIISQVAAGHDPYKVIQKY